MNKCLFTATAFLFLLTRLTDAQSLRPPVSVMYPGLGAYSTKQADVFSFATNQAALAQIKSNTAGVYGEKPYLLDAANLCEAAVAFPTAMGNFGVALLYSGFKNFNEGQIGIAYARSLGSALDIGVQFNYYGYRVPSYINATTVNVEMGALIHLTGRFNIGFHVYNLIGGRFNKTSEKLTTTWKAGSGYDASEKLFVSAELVKETNYPPSINAGLEYQFINRFYAKAGISSAAAVMVTGFGIGWSNLRLDISGSYHPQLGWSPGLLLIINRPNPAITGYAQDPLQ